ncbi:enoyl-CoA hydratase-related protein [Chromobacterium sp. IIBBL 290-4]|uniref:enoyl-CoA hydratase-related protein n=1 Tax=Chromobacterium sp. IIBBL 290-4 TaxID=2953890 RepID=UPI0020B7D58B|nr:enoyl-CoA hydratase-related protein [Chromobacterium sp. IIBBL 290-4]UTH74753.1 enoyl-CoA hydratase-related protein [Chromobacterium sp. IIBBL 290-4]
MKVESVLLSVDKQGVATVTLNRADLHNALDDETISLLAATLETVAEDNTIHAVVLTGSGISFSAGHDPDWLRRLSQFSASELNRYAQQTAQLLHTLDTLPKPTVAKVQGSAFGLGVALVACCDIAIGVSEALFSLSEVRFGQIPALSTPYLIRAIGERAARRYCITAERFNAGKAKRLGLIHQVVENDEIDAAVRHMLGQLLLNSPAAMRAAKHLIGEIGHQDISLPVMQRCIEHSLTMRMSEEGREGINALIEMRKPGWMD